MPKLFGSEVSDHVYESNKHLEAPPKADKTQARKQWEAEQRKRFALTFEANWRLLDGPTLEPEFQFCPERKWRADYRVGNLLIELDGGIYSGGRHTRGKGFAEDCVKLNTATMLGYRLIRIPTGFATTHYLQQIIDFLKGQEIAKSEPVADGRTYAAGCAP